MFKIFKNQEKNIRIFNSSPRMTFLLGLLISLAFFSTVAFIILLIFTVKKTDSPPPKTPETVYEEEHIRGAREATVTLVEYSDFECPFCARFQPTLEKALSEYQGQIKLVFKHFPLSFHEEAQEAAEASECAAEQGKFWEMHDKIFAANLAGQMSIEKWKEEAANLGLNISQFNDCLDSEKYKEKIERDIREGTSKGVKGTPATFVNGELVSGAIPYEDFQDQSGQRREGLKSIIEKKLTGE